MHLLLTWNRQLTAFESLHTRITPQRHLISYIYTLLQDNLSPPWRDALRLSWEGDLKMILSDDNWECIHKGSMNVAIQENGYKIATKWYRTPACLHKFSPKISNTCWRCKRAVGSMFHIWWECTLIQQFWSEVHALITQITTLTLDYGPAQYLLHHANLPKKHYHKSLAYGQCS